MVFVVNFAMDKMRFRVDYMRARGPSVGPFAALLLVDLQKTDIGPHKKVYI